MTASYPDCENCVAPCCTRQYMEDDDGWYTVADARPLYRAAGTDIKVVGWFLKDDGGHQPSFQCLAFDTKHLGCTIYEKRPEHCRVYDCRDDDPEEEQGRPRCDVARHRRMEAARARAAARRPRTA